VSSAVPIPSRPVHDFRAFDSINHRPPVPPAKFCCNNSRNLDQKKPTAFAASRQRVHAILAGLQRRSGFGAPPGRCGIARSSPKSPSEENPPPVAQVSPSPQRPAHKLVPRRTLPRPRGGNIAGIAPERRRTVARKTPRHFRGVKIGIAKHPRGTWRFGGAPRFLAFPPEPPRPENRIGPATNLLVSPALRVHPKPTGTAGRPWALSVSSPGD